MRRYVGKQLERTIGRSRTTSLRQLERRVRTRLGPPAPAPPKPRPSLTELAQKHKTDKWGTHRYTPHYEASLKHLRDESFTLLEIGIGGFKTEGSGGNSLRMWRDFFPNATIVGLDIIDKSYVAGGRVEVYTGDQTDAELLQRIVDDHPDLKVVIDDGSHVSAHILASFKTLFPLLPMDGIYAIEDTQTSYWPDWGGQVDPEATGTSMHLVKKLDPRPQLRGVPGRGLRADLHRHPRHRDPRWHNMVVIEKGANHEGSNRDRVHDRPYRM